MRCYLLARGFTGEEMAWAIPADQNDFLSLMLNHSIGLLKTSLSEFINLLEPGGYHHIEKDGYHFYARMLSRGYFGLACDSTLESRQLDHLCRYLLIECKPLQEVADACEAHLENRQIQAMKQELANTTEQMKDNLIKMDRRGALLTKLLSDTEELEYEAKVFHHQAAELNQCWPDVCSWFSFFQPPALPSLTTLTSFFGKRR